jgi:glucan phosphoethanolaminetransferase (alkaline phosphatase superfamily)
MTRLFKALSRFPVVSYVDWLMLPLLLLFGIFFATTMAGGMPVHRQVLAISVFTGVFPLACRLLAIASDQGTVLKTFWKWTAFLSVIVFMGTVIFWGS